MHKRKRAIRKPNDDVVTCLKECLDSVDSSTEGMTSSDFFAEFSGDRRAPRLRERGRVVETPPSL